MTLIKICFAHSAHSWKRFYDRALPTLCRTHRTVLKRIYRLITGCTSYDFLLNVVLWNMLTVFNSTHRTQLMKTALDTLIQSCDNMAQFEDTHHHLPPQSAVDLVVQLPTVDVILLNNADQQPLYKRSAFYVDFSNMNEEVEQIVEAAEAGEAAKCCEKKASELK